MNLVERAKNLIVQPKQEWPVVAGESHTVQGLYTQYVMILAAIPAVATFIGQSIVGFGGFGFAGGYRVPIPAGVAQMVVGYLLSLGLVYVMALVIDALATQFGAARDFMQSLKVAAFAPTAAWVAGLFYLVPLLAILALVGWIYSLYLLYLGLQAVKRPPADKLVPYAVVVIVVMIVASLLVGGIAALAIPSPVRGF